MRVQEDLQLLRHGKLNNGQKEKMIFLGHSLGGYLSVLYAHRFPERVEQLLLVSAVGVPECPRDFSLQDLPEAKTSSLILLRQWQIMWDKHYTPLSGLRIGGSFAAKKLLETWSKRSMKGIEKQEQQAFNDVLH